MAATRTFSIIKPDATRRNLTGAITKMLEEAGLRVVASRRIRMTRDQAEGFYGVHRERPFFNDLCTFMTSGPVVVQVLEGDRVQQVQPPRAALPRAVAGDHPVALEEPDDRGDLRLRRAEGAEDTVLRSEVAELRPTGQSLMPAGFEQVLTVEDMADLLKYLTQGRPR